MSRRREAGLDVNWGQAITTIPRRAIKSILSLTLILMAIFAAWLLTAQVIYNSTMGPEVAPSILEFVDRVLTTPEGLQLLLLGNAAGFGFALLVLMVSAVSFPMLIDREVGARSAMLTSVRTVLRNPVTMLTWGAIIVVMLAVGFALMLFGLAVTLPVLGHASWHLYRKVVEPGEASAV
jgi:uncharacterized membrane protein